MGRLGLEPRPQPSILTILSILLPDVCCYASAALSRFTPSSRSSMLQAKDMRR